MLEAYVSAPSSEFSTDYNSFSQKKRLCIISLDVSLDFPYHTLRDLQGARKSLIAPTSRLK